MKKIYSIAQGQRNDLKLGVLHRMCHHLKHVLTTKNLEAL
jgi:hypothetical protein